MRRLFGLLDRLVSDRRIQLVVLASMAYLILAYAVPAPADQLRTVVAIAGLAVVLTVIIGVHEFCHLLAARALGIEVVEFGLGIPPRVASRQWRGITWSLNALPVGGFVRLHGESEDEGPGSFVAAPTWKQVTILAAGPVSNVVLALVLLTGLAAFARVDAGLSPLDAPVAAWQAMTAYIGTWLGLIVALPGMLLSDPVHAPVSGIPMMGVAVDAAMQHPAAVFVMLALVALLSLTVGLMNLLPIPPLDGGQTMLAVLRGVSRGHFPERVATVAVIVGVVFIVALGLLVNGIDLVRLFTGSTT